MVMYDSDYACVVCKRDTSKFDEVFQIYLTRADSYTDCMEQTYVCTPCMGEFGEMWNEKDYIRFQK